MTRVLVICVVVLLQNFSKGAGNDTKAFPYCLSFVSRPVAYPKKDYVPGSYFLCDVNFYFSNYGGINDLFHPNGNGSSIG